MRHGASTDATFRNDIRATGVFLQHEVSDTGQWWPIRHDGRWLPCADSAEILRLTVVRYSYNVLSASFAWLAQYVLVSASVDC